MMRLKIDKKTLDQTTSCKWDFSCICQECPDMCKAQFSLSDKVLFVQPASCRKDCVYLISFGFRYICACPTRNEIYQKYQQ